MRKTLFLCTFLIMNLALHSQGLNAELAFNDEFHQHVQGVVSIENGSYLSMMSSISGANYSGSSLHLIDTLGNILWSTSIAPTWAEYITVTEMQPSDDGGVYVLGYGQVQCDYLSECFWYLQKYNPTRNAEWTRIWPGQVCLVDKMSGLSNLSQDTISVNYFDGNMSYYMTLGSTGNTVDSIQTTHHGIQGFATLSGYAFTGYKQDSLMGFNHTGTLVKSQLFSSQVQGIHTLNDTLYVLTHDSIFLFSGTLQPILGASIQGHTAYRKLKVSGDHIRFISHGSTSLSVITLDRQLQVTGIITIPEAISQQTDVDFNEQHLSAGITFDLAMHHAVRYLDYSLISTQNQIINHTDIAIAGIQPTHTFAWPHPSLTNVYIISLAADVLIKNLGPDTLYSCRINHTIGYGKTCSPLVFSTLLINLNIKPGDSIWVPLGSIHQEENYFSGPEISKNICVYSSNPNQTTDLNVSNDNFCKEVLFGYVGIEEHEKDALLNLYPNPTGRLIHFNLPAGAVEVSVYTLQGRLVHHELTTEQQTDLTALPSGVFLVRLFHSEQQKVYSAKVVKW